MENWRFANRGAEWRLLMALKKTADRVSAEEKIEAVKRFRKDRPCSVFGG